MRAFLHDARAFTVVFADDDDHAALDTARREIGKCVARNICADRRFEGHSAAQRIIHRYRSHRSRRRLTGARFEVHAKFLEDFLRIRQHIHQVRDRCALVPANVGNAGLQQGLGNREDAFARKLLARAKPEFFDFFFE